MIGANWGRGGWPGVLEVDELEVDELGEQLDELDEVLESEGDTR